jgi:VWFA-related protein
LKLNPLFALSCALLAFLFCPAFPAQQQPKPDESDKHLKIQTTLVTLPVIAMDSDSRFIPDLRATNFQVFEEGLQQEITFFASAEEPLTVALLLDVSDSTESQMENIRQAAIAFAGQLRATDKVMVVAFDSRTQILTEAVGDQQEIRDAILPAKTGGGTRLYDALDFVIRERMRTHLCHQRTDAHSSWAQGDDSFYRRSG